MKSLLLLMVLYTSSALSSFGESPPIRPGKGMELIPGDVAEYSNTLYEGEKKADLPSTIMISAGKHGEYEKVRVIMADGDKLCSVNTVLFDLSKAKVKKGKVVDSGTEKITICGTEYDCTWEKRVDNGVTATFWTCSQLPFEKYARVVIEKDGKKQITELSFYEPMMMSKDFVKFQARLDKLMSQVK